MYQPLIKQLEQEMTKVVTGFGDTIKTLRTGRASASLVEDVVVQYYGAPTPLKHTATITTPDPKMVVITPWDKSILGEIENAIRTAELGVNPVNDGTVVRVSIPPMTEERRKELVKKLHQMAEEVNVALRSLRRDVWEKIQNMEQAATISEDDMYAAEKELNKSIDGFQDKVQSMASAKEQEIMSI